MYYNFCTLTNKSTIKINVFCFSESKFQVAITTVKVLVLVLATDTTTDFEPIIIFPLINIQNLVFTQTGSLHLE